MAQVTFLSLRLPQAVTVRVSGRNRDSLLRLAQRLRVPLRCARSQRSCGRCGACAVKVATVHPARRATRHPTGREREALRRAGKRMPRAGAHLASHGPFWRLASHYVPGEDVWVAF